MKLLLKAGLKKQRRSCISVLILVTIMTAAVVMAISLNDHSRTYTRNEMTRLGFGNLTMWVSGERDLNELETEMEALPEVTEVSYQDVIFAGYTINNNHSDDEGQLLVYQPERYAYRIFNEEQSGYQTIGEIESGEIYVSPVMAATFDAKIGDTIRFRLSRDGINQEFRIAGYFEDPFMGSSMIDMKSFLIGADDFSKISQMIEQASSMNVLARVGAMFHITQPEVSTLPSSELASYIEASMKITEFVEFSYSESSIYGFMLILQNIITGFLLAFAIILLLISSLILGRSISNAIEQDYKDMGILKTMGSTTNRLRYVQLLQYLVPILVGILLGIVLASTLSKQMVETMVFSSGMLIPSGISMVKVVIILTIVLLIFCVFIYVKLRKLSQITPIQAIQGNGSLGPSRKIRRNVNQRVMLLSLAIRQMQVDRKRYYGTAVVAFLLVLFTCIVGAMNGWLGPNGEGLMNSFSVAEHDLGVEPNHSMDMRPIEAIIQNYANIVDTYELAMQNVSVNQVDYTANVLDEPEWFQILEGRTTTDSDEIVVTEYVAADLGVTIGDEVTIRGNNQSANYTIVGVYACANQMGANIGMTREGYARISNVEDYIWCKHYILATSEYNDIIMEQIQSQYPMDVDVHTNSWSGLNSIVNTMKMLTNIMYGIVLLIIVVVVMLTSSKFLQKEQTDMAILKSQGMTAMELRLSFMLRYGVVSFVGIVAGVLVSMAFSNAVIGNVLRFFGISNFHTRLGVNELLIIPVVVLLLFMGTAYLYSKKIKKLDVVSLVSER
ncbi:MAG: ABC transporter permease [bacterium]|nr:ABC transporter permease [bacterium]